MKSKVKTNDQTQSAKVDWVKILGKGANGAKTLFEPIMPATVNTINSTTSVMKDIRNATRYSRLTSNRDPEKAKNSQGNKRSLDLFNSAFNDIESGSFSINRINDSMFDDYENESASAFEMPSGDDAVDMSTEEILLSGNRGVAQSIIQSSSAQLKGLEATSKSLINANIKSTQALGMTINSTLNFGFNSINRNLIIQNQKIDMVNRNIGALIEFNNTNAIEFYSKSIDMMAGFGKMMDNLQKASMPDPRKKSRVFDTSDGFSIKNYIDYVKEGIKESLLGTAGQMTGGIISSSVKQRDFGMIGNIVEAIIPKAIKEPLANFDKSLTRMMDEGFKRLGEYLNSGFANGFGALFGLGDIFGSKRETLKSLNMGAYMREALPWNGEAQKTLVEVIPELLTSIDSKINGTEKRYFDYEKGQFRNKSEIQKAFEDEYFDTFSIMLREAMTSLKKSAKDTGKTDNEQENLIKAINALIDDQISGNKNTMDARTEMTRAMKEFGIGNNEVSNFIMEFQNGLEGAISRINDLYNDIGKTQSVYRNINNTYGKEAYKDLKKSHTSHKKANNQDIRYDEFSFLGGIAANDFINDIRKRIGLPEKMDDEQGFIDQILNMKNNKASSSAIESAIRQHDAGQRISSGAGRFKIVDKFKRGSENLGKKITKVTDAATNAGYKYTYLDKRRRNLGYGPATPSSMASYAASNGYISQGGANAGLFTEGANKLGLNSSRVRNQSDLIKNLIAGNPAILTGRSSSTKDPYTKAGHIVVADGLYGNKMSIMDPMNGKHKFYNTNDVSNKTENAWAYSAGYGPDQKPKRRIRRSTKNNGVPSKVSRAADQIDYIREESYDQTMNQSQSELKNESEKLNNAISTLISNDYEPENVEETIIKSNTLLQSALGAILSGFKSFTARLFGKEGFFSKLWNSETRKKITDKIKTELFTGEDAIFKDEYDKLRSGWTKVKGGLRKLKNDTNAKLGKGYDFLYDNTMQYLYGEKYNESEDYKDNKFVSEKLNRKWRAEQKKKRADEKKNIVLTNTQALAAANTASEASSTVSDVADNVNESAESLVNSFRALVEVTTGDPNTPPEQKKKLFTGEFFKRLKDNMPKTLAAAIGGAGIGLLNNKFSLLGSMFLPGGPIAGAIVGGGLSILSQTEAFKRFIYGEIDPNDPTGKTREGGLISQELQEKFRKMMPFAIGGAVTGGLKSIVTGALGFNSGLGVLGMQMLPGGIVGGAILGAGLGILKNSDSFQDFLFGKKDENGKRKGKFLSDSFNKVKDGVKDAIPGLKKMGAGLGIGALSGAVLSHMGYIPAMLSLGGPVGMGIAGLGIGIASTTKKFNEWMFGSEDPDTRKRRKDGVLTRVTNMLRLNIMEPIGDAFKTKMLDLVDWTKDKITYPFRLAMGPILDSLGGIKNNIVDFVKEKFEDIGNGISSLISKALKGIFSPITRLIGFVGKSVIGIASSGIKLALAPLSAGLKGLQFLTMGKRRKVYKDFAGDYYTRGGMKTLLDAKWRRDAEDGEAPNIFQKMSDTISAALGQGEVFDTATQYWREMAGTGNKLNWMDVSLIGNEKRDHKLQVKARHADEKRWMKIDKERNKIARKLGHRELTLSDNAVKDYQEIFGGLGISKEYLKNSEDIMDLVYRRDKFKQKLTGNPTDESTSALTVQETPEQKAARENTKKFQDEMKESLHKIVVKLGADTPNNKDLTEIAEEISKSTSDSADAEVTQAEVATNGEYNDTVKVKRGRNLKANIVSKFNALTAFLGFKKKKKAEDAESAESAIARSGTEALIDEVSDVAVKTNEAKEKKQSVFSKIWGKIKSVGSYIGGTGLGKVGKFIWKGVKVAGAIGLLGSLGLTIAEVIKPGTTEKIGAKIDAFNEFADNFDLKKLYDEKVVPIFDTFGSKLSTVYEEKIQPKLEKIPEIICEKLPSIIASVGTFISNHVDELVSAFKLVIEDIGIPLVKAIVDSTPEILGAVIKGSWEIVKELGTSLYDIITGKTKKEDISDIGKVTNETSGTQVSTNLVGTIDVSTDSDESAIVSTPTNNQTKKEKRQAKRAANKAARQAKRDARKNNKKSTEDEVDDNSNAEETASAMIEPDIEAATEAAKTAYNLNNPTVVYNDETGQYEVYQNVITGSRVARDANTGEEVVIKNSQLAGATGKLATKGALDFAFNTYGGRALKGMAVAGAGVSAGVKLSGKTLSTVGKVGGKALGWIPGVGIPIKVVGKGMELTGNAISKVGSGGLKLAKNAVKNITTGTTNTVVDSAVDMTTRYAKNSAGRWFDTTTGKFVKKEVAEAAVNNADNIAEAGASSFKSNIDNIISKIGGIFKKKATNEVAEEGSEELIQRTAEAATKKVGKEVTEKTQESMLSLLLKKFSVWLADVAESKAMSAAVKKVAAEQSDNIIKKIIKFVGSALDTILANSSKCLKKLIDLATAAVARITGQMGAAVATLGITELVFIGTGSLFGALDAANLFQTKEPDGIMRIVSSLFEALLSIGVMGSLLDFIFAAYQLIGEILGKDWNFKKQFAEFLYLTYSGYTEESFKKLEVGQAALQSEKDVYNALNDTNLSISAYNEEANKTVFSKILGVGKKAINGIGKLFGKNWLGNSVDTETAEQARQALLNAGYTDAQITDWAQNDTTKLDEALKSVGYGSGGKAPRLNSLYAQGNPKWANVPIGRLPDGSIATMANAGCGPTAMAAVANTVAQRSLGYGPISPADMAAYAASNGYISQGGANAGLFTDGAKKLGLNSSPVTNQYSLMNNLKSGKPVVLTGKSTNGNDPYTKAGHIVVADGTIGDKISIIDPITGKRKLYKTTDVSKKTKHAWAYSAGYGPSPDPYEEHSSSTRTAFGGTNTGFVSSSGGGRGKITSIAFGGTTSGFNDSTGGGRKDSLPSLNKDSSEYSGSISYDDSTSSTETEVNTGIINAEQLKEYASTKGFLGKLSLFGTVLQARINSLFKDTSFWEEFGNLTKDKTSGSDDITLTDTSGTDSTTDSNVSVTSGTNAEKAWKFFRRKLGFSSYAAAGALGNLMAENGMRFKVLEGDYLVGRSDAKAYNKVKNNRSLNTYTEGTLFPAYVRSNVSFNKSAYKGSDGNWYPGIGIGSWTGPRGKNFIDYIKSHNYDYWDPDTQLSFYKNDLLARSPSIASKINAASSPSAAAAIFLDKAEMYDGFAERNKTNVTIPRQKYAEAYYKKYKSLGYGPDDVISTNSSTSALTSSIGVIGNEMINYFSKMTGIDPAELGLTSQDSTSSDLNTSSGGGTASFNTSGNRISNISGTDRGRFLAAAKSQIGYLEKKDASNLIGFTANPGSNSYTKYAQEIGGWNGLLNGKYPAHWCNFFTSWAAKAAGIPTDIVNRSSSCTETAKYYKNKGLYYSSDKYSGKPGDLVFFNWNKNKNSPDHIGIVTSTDKDNVYTIEGNTSNGSGYDAVAAKTRSRSAGTIIGFATPPWTNEEKSVDPRNLLSLGYGNAKFENIDSPAYREQTREKLEGSEDFKVSPKDFEAFGFGPGMSVDAGFDMTNTDSKLDKIFGLIAEWYSDAKKNTPAQSAGTNNINVVKATTNNVTEVPNASQPKKVQKYKESMANNHSMLSSKAIIRTNM